MPGGIVMQQYDPTVQDSDVGFRSFTLDDLHIEFADGTRTDCIDRSSAVSERTFPIARKGAWLDQKFPGVISKRMDFSIYIKGCSIRDNGTRVPFEKRLTYRYRGKSTEFTTFIEEWKNA